MRSASAPEAPYAPLEPGFSTQRHGGRDWRVFSLRSGEHWVQAAERDDVRGELSAKLALAAVVPVIAGIPLVALLLALLLGYGLAPLPSSHGASHAASRTRSHPSSSRAAPPKSRP